MRDPHVAAIHYKVGSVETISYDDPKPMSFSNNLGEFSLSSGKLRVIPVEHFSREGEARGAIEPFLRTWEIGTDLNLNFGMVRFEFESAELIDRAPPQQSGSTSIRIESGSMVLIGGNVSLRLTCREYPRPPIGFSATPEVVHAYRRWLRYKAGNEPLQSMAYFVLTLLESPAGGRQPASLTFKIDLDVLRTIGRLSSTKGDEVTARKASSQGSFQELTPLEKQWLEEAVRCIIRRFGEHASGAQLSVITMADLPRI